MLSMGMEYLKGRFLLWYSDNMTAVAAINNRNLKNTLKEKIEKKLKAPSLYATFTCIEVVFLSKEFVKKHAKTLFIFGDNWTDKKTGFQPKSTQAQVRGEKNCFGFSTCSDKNKGFRDKDLNTIDPAVELSFLADIVDIVKIMADGGFSHLAIPTNGLGTGKAKINQRSATMKQIESHCNLLKTGKISFLQIRAILARKLILENSLKISRKTASTIKELEKASPKILAPELSDCKVLLRKILELCTTFKCAVVALHRSGDSNTRDDDTSRGLDMLKWSPEFKFLSDTALKSASYDKLRQLTGGGDFQYDAFAHHDGSNAAPKWSKFQKNFLYFSLANSPYNAPLNILYRLKGIWWPPIAHQLQALRHLVQFMSIRETVRPHTVLVLLDITGNRLFESFYKHQDDTLAEFLVREPKQGEKKDISKAIQRAKKIKVLKATTTKLFKIKDGALSHADIPFMDGSESSGAMQKHGLLSKFALSATTYSTMPAHEVLRRKKTHQ
jgi:hypothetical protein